MKANLRRLRRYICCCILLTALATDVSAQSRSGVRGGIRSTPPPSHAIGLAAGPNPRAIPPNRATPAPPKSTLTFYWILSVIALAVGYRFLLALQSRNAPTMTTPISAAEMLNEADRDRLSSKANLLFGTFTVLSAICISILELFIAGRLGSAGGLSPRDLHVWIVFLVWLFPFWADLSVAAFGLRVERDLRAGRAAILEGPAQVEWIRGRHGAVPVLRMQGVSLGLSRQHADQLRQRQERRVYYAAQSRIFLRSELLKPNA